MFIETIKEIMEVYHINMVEFAEIIGCNKSAVLRWLYDRFLPDPKTLIKICYAFNISADYLFGFSDEKELVRKEHNNTFYQRYLKLRDENNFTDYYVGKACGFTDGTISKWKKRKGFPTTYSLTQVATLFKCSMDYLLGIG